MHKPSIVSSFVIFFCATLAAQELSPVALPKPQTDGGKPLMQALRDRASQREFASDALSPQVLSNLLWAAWGVSRPESGKRTAPSAMNRQEMDIYVATADGLYRYEAKEHRLQPVTKDDVRALTGTQPYVGTAPVNLIYVSRAGGGSAEDQAIYGGAHAGFISENVYLFCASEGLATVVRASINREALAKAMQLGPGQKIVLAQTIGYPKKK
ncbi:MAG: SagB/ThcOx family dehydrogenase [Opitutaceae bacterium]|nr:SagB/ThcOx family dehydrogenase [Opitutaceae bacterium]